MGGWKRHVDMLADPKIALVTKRRQPLGDQKGLQGNRVRAIFTGVRDENIVFGGRNSCHGPAL
ncbi:MAG: hypothetical protein SH859_06015 [Hyphomicrobium aestuarii]|nr:hypothetical protein [Hyphomicrobium aestuarii]